MKQIDIVVVGGSAAGLTAAITARRHYPDKAILMVRKEKQVLTPCGIPYVFGTVGRHQENLIGDAVLEKNNIGLLLTEATDIDREEKVLHTTEGSVGYERLIIATGLIELPIFILTNVHSTKKVPYRFALDEDYLPVDVFLDKPIEPKQLVATIQEMLGERREEPEHPL